MLNNTIYSLEYFNFLGLVHADKNTNGKIDDDEKNIFDDFMKQFDMNKNGKVEEDDVLLYRQSVEYTDDEIKASRELKEFYESHPAKKGSGEIPVFERELSGDEQKRLSDINSRLASLSKLRNVYKFAEYMIKAGEYLKNLSGSAAQEVYLKYGEIIKNMYDELNNNTR